jgi:hypothetical protein
LSRCFALQSFKKCIYCGQPAQNVDGICHYFDYTHVFKGEEIKKWGMAAFPTTGTGRDKGVRNAGPACAFCGGYKRACGPLTWVYHLHRVRSQPPQPHHAHWSELQKLIEEGEEGGESEEGEEGE